MQNRIDATIDMARAEREALRWILLSALWHARPYGATEHVLLMTARDVMRAGPSGAGRAVDAETPVRQVMEMLRDGATELAVTEGGQTIGSIGATEVMARLINPQGQSHGGAAAEEAPND